MTRNINVKFDFKIVEWYQRKKSLKIPKGNQNPYIEEKQTTQWPEEKLQKDKERSTKHTHTIKDRVTRTRVKLGYEIMSSGRVCRSSTSGIGRVNKVEIQ